MKQNYSYESAIQPMYRDHLFIAIFGKDSERSKRWRLELYNALNNSNYSDPESLELNTLENVLFIKMHNDVSFLIDAQMTLYEHQSSPNPNFIVFYNGKIERPERYDLQLSDAFISEDKSGDYQWTAHVININ